MKKIFVFGVICFLVSCKKEGSNINSCTTNVASIAGSYKVTSLKYKANSGATETEIINTLDACQRDDISIFNSNGVYNYQDAGAVCTPNGNLTSSWSLNGNTIVIDGDIGIIQSFNCSILIISINDVINPGDKLTVTYIKQ